MPTALDNGKRSPAKLLRAVVAVGRSVGLLGYLAVAFEQRRLGL